MGQDSPAAVLYDSAGNALVTSASPTQGTELGLIVRPVGANIDGQKATYSASILGLVASSTAPTDLFTIYGSATKTIRVTRLAISGTQTTAAVRDVALIKRSSANSGGTSTPLTAVPHDANAAAATATVLAYTANPTLGTTVGSVRAHKLFVGTTAGSGAVDDIIWDFGTRPSQCIVLRGTAQGICINVNGVVSAGSSFDINAEFTEE